LHYFQARTRIRAKKKPFFFKKTQITEKKAQRRLQRDSNIMININHIYFLVCFRTKAETFLKKGTKNAGPEVSESGSAM